MATLADLREERLRKVKLLVDAGISPYPNDPQQDYSLKEVFDNYSKLSKRKKPFCVVGRIMQVRAHGGSIFVDLYDGTAKLQGYIKKDEIGEEAFSLFKEVYDLGDFIELKGKLFITKKKEKSLLATEWRMLAKSLRPFPDKWHGLSDVEERFRRRYLDIAMNHEVRDRFVMRSHIIREIRNFLDDDGFLEVDTPMLQIIPGGATAKPFKTFHNALDTEMYLRVAPELYLKKLLVGGITKVYEMGRSFRNEGIDVTHNPEFTSLEVYTAYSDAVTERKRIERLMETVVKKVCKKKVVEYDGKKIEIRKPFKTVRYASLLKQYALIGESSLSKRDEVADKAKQLGISVTKADGIEKILDNIYKKVCRPKLIEPTFIIDYPAEFAPLAKRQTEKPWLVDKFQLVIAGMEIVNGYIELNDPSEQRQRFIEQEERRKEGDDEAHIQDEDFVEALEYGMPPATGWAIGIERFVMFLTDVKNIREVVIFPTLKQKE